MKHKVNEEDKPVPDKKDPPKSSLFVSKEEREDFVRTALIAILLALFIRTFFYEPFNIPSSSMRPTLEVGDYLFVHKPAYGYSKHSFPLSLAPIEGRIWPGDVRRGDVVVFKQPRNEATNFIKRVVALPGETVQVRQGRLYINGDMIQREALGLRRIKSDSQIPVTVMEYIETLPGGVVHRIFEKTDDEPLDNTRIYEVPEGHYFVMGDNRDYSQDSRVQGQVGFIPFENIVGRADFIFFSTNSYARIYEIWKWPWSVRYERLFKSIDPFRPDEGDKGA